MAVVVGTAARRIAEQVRQLADLGLPVLTLDPHELLEVAPSAPQSGPRSS